MELSTKGYSESFVEEIISDYIRDIICNETIDEVICDRLDNQPLSLFEWTNNLEYTSHGQVRNRVVENCMNKVPVSQDSSSVNASGVRPTVRTSNLQQIRKSERRGTNQEKLEHLDKVVINEYSIFDKAASVKLDEKYMKDITDKFNYTDREINEKMLFIKEESRNLIGSIMEDTIYNVIAEAVYGEASLVESTKIYFYNKNK